MEHENEKLETMLEQLLRGDVLESPSANFTHKVMNEVYAIEESSSSVFQYKPLISKRAWWVIAIVFTALIAYIWTSGGASTESSLLYSVQLPKFNYSVLDNLKWQLTGAFKYGAIFFIIMILVQMTVLKSYFDKRFSI